MTKTSLTAVLAAILAATLSLEAQAEDAAAASASTSAASRQVAPAAVDKADSPAAATAQASDSYTPPPGFKTKTRKGETVYCRSRAPIGTRIKSEECFTEAEIKEVERAMAISTEDTRQRGRMCTTGMMCTGQGGG